MLIKTPLLHQSSGPHVFLSLSLSLRLIFWSAETRRAHSPAQASKTLSRRHTVPSPHLERAPAAFMSDASPVSKDFIGFMRKPRNISLFLSLFYFLIIDSGPPGFSPLKDPNIILDTFYTSVNSKMIKYLNLCFCSKPIVKLQSNRPIVLCDTRSVSPLQEGTSRSQLVLRKTSLELLL